MAIHCVKLWRINYFKKNRLEAIVLAGGLGTRLKSEIKKIPKPMALIYDKPFLFYLLNNLANSGVSRVILSVGYKFEKIVSYFGYSFFNCEIIYSIEQYPLGTGGALRKALDLAISDDVLLINGDTYANINLSKMFQFHLDNKSAVTLALKEIKNTSRYGIVEIDENNKICSFKEKKQFDFGMISMGSYIIKKKLFNGLKFPKKFSLETDFFQKKVQELPFYGFIQNDYFIDIGIPEDYWKAQFEIGLQSMIDKSWTLFLDRDGVINQKIDNDYVKKIKDFKFLDGVLEAISFLSNKFGKIIIVTNQQGVGKGLMSLNELNKIHKFLKKEVKTNGGQIDDIFIAPQLENENSSYRKPNIGMANLAKEKYPNINFNKSIMVGDSLSDLKFAQNLNMNFIYISNDEKLYKASIYTCLSLMEFRKILTPKF